MHCAPCVNDKGRAGDRNHSSTAAPPPHRRFPCPWHTVRCSGGTRGESTHLNTFACGKTELDPAILRRGTVFVEFEPQTRIEGEIQAMPADFPVTQLWKVLTGKAAGRTNDDHITVFDSVGFAIEDYSALRYLRECVNGTSLCEEIDLVADPDDPKNLFGFALSPSPVG
ncbi:hypothetical protein ACWD26_42250 [Streptomyces sp. NPDC002787]